jgi:hypothetical protein
MSACQATALLVAEFIRAGVCLRFGDAENSPLGIAGGEHTEAPAGLRIGNHDPDVRVRGEVTRR